jgi:hypothetical protein
MVDLNLQSVPVFDGSAEVDAAVGVLRALDFKIDGEVAEDALGPETAAAFLPCEYAVGDLPFAGARLLPKIEIIAGKKVDPPFLVSLSFGRFRGSGGPRRISGTNGDEDYCKGPRYAA